MKSNANAAARSVVLWAGLALLCALIAAGWWASRTMRAPRAFREADPIEANLASSSDAGAPGSVRVHVVDASDGSALANVAVELVSEEPLRMRFGRALSDAHGDAQFKDVFAPLVLASSRRSERFAPALSIARGEPATTRVALLRLGAGGQLSGRVIDDTGVPVLGAEVFLQDNSPCPDPLLPSMPAARTGADGSYTIERVVNLPRLITARPPNFFAAAWSQVILEARGPGTAARGAGSVTPCGTTIAADLVLPRPPTLAGRVLDAARRPLVGALVSVNQERQRLADVNLHAVDRKAFDAGLADLPGMPRFELRAGEALTDDSGAFELVGASPRSCALVAATDGRLEVFALGAWRPGEHIGPREFVQAEREVLRLRLFDAEDRPILGEPPQLDLSAVSADGSPRMRLQPISGMLCNAWTSSKVDLLALLDDAREVRVQVAPLGDGTFSFALPCALSSIEHFSLSAPGYKTLERAVRGRLRADSSVSLEHLERLDNLELHIALRDFEMPPGSEAQTLQIRACALAPEDVSDPAHPRPICCGFGMYAELVLESRAQDLSMPMLTERPMWLTVRSIRGGRSEEVVRGPFTMKGGVKNIELEALPPGRAKFGRGPPTDSRSDPLEDRGHARASLCVFDAESGGSLRDASVWAVCDPLGRETLLARTWSADADGCVALDDLAFGSWRFVVASAGHRAQTLGPVEISATSADEAQLDLGEVRLAPVH